MKRLALRSTLALTLVSLSLTSAQAGIIPWVYDAIFGPVRYPAYGVPYQARYSPAPASYASPWGSCSPCVSAPRRVVRQSSPCSSGRCSTGNCPTTVAYYPAWPLGGYVVQSSCPTNCSTKKTDWRATGNASEEKSTYAKEGDPFVGQTEAQKLTPTADGELQKVRPAGATSEETGEVTTAAGESTETEEETASTAEEKSSVEAGVSSGDLLETSKRVNAGEETSAAEEAPSKLKPRATTEEEKAAAEAEAAAAESGTNVEVETPVVEDAASEDESGFGGAEKAEETKAPELPATEGEEASETSEESEATKALEKLKEKTTWTIDRPVHRIAFRASFSNVRLARRTPAVKSDYVITLKPLTRIAER